MTWVDKEGDGELVELGDSVVTDVSVTVSVFGVLGIKDVTCEICVDTDFSVDTDVSLTVVGTVIIDVSANEDTVVTEITGTVMIV